MPPRSPPRLIRSHPLTSALTRSRQTTTTWPSIDAVAQSLAGGKATAPTNTLNNVSANLIQEYAYLAGKRDYMVSTSSHPASTPPSHSPRHAVSRRNGRVPSRSAPFALTPANTEPHTTVSQPNTDQKHVEQLADNFESVIKSVYVL